MPKSKAPKMDDLDYSKYRCLALCLVPHRHCCFLITYIHTRDVDGFHERFHVEVLVIFFVKHLKSKSNILLSHVEFVQCSISWSTHCSAFIHVWPPSVVYICTVSVCFYQRLNILLSTLCI